MDNKYDETYESLKGELKNIKEEVEINNKIKNMILNEEDFSYEDIKLLSNNQNQIDYWKSDNKLQNILYEQQEILNNIKREKTQFTEKVSYRIEKRNNQLIEEEEELRSSLDKFDKQKREDNDGENNKTK